MTQLPNGATRRSYDRIALSYRERFERELDHKPFDRSFLDTVAADTSDRGWVIDLGCGPGQIARYLADRGVAILGLDLSFEMLGQMPALLPVAPRIQADMRGVPLSGGSIVGVVAFYSIIHVPPEDLDGTVAEIRRVLVPGGHFAVTSHATAPADRAAPANVSDGGALHVEEMLAAPVDLNFYFYPADRLARTLEDGGFRVLSSLERDPYTPDIEVQTRRAYILAERL